MPSIAEARFPRALCNSRGSESSITNFVPPLAFHVPPIARQSRAPIIETLRKPGLKPGFVMKGGPHRSVPPGVTPQNGIVRINQGAMPSVDDYIEMLEYGPRDTFVEMNRGGGHGVGVYVCEQDGSVRELRLRYSDLPVVSLEQAKMLISYFGDEPDAVLCLWRRLGATSLMASVPERERLMPYDESRTGRVMYVFVPNHADRLWHRLMVNSASSGPICDYLEWVGENPIPVRE